MKSKWLDRHLLAVAFGQCTAWGILYYTFAVVAEPMRLELGLSQAQAAGAFSLGLAVSVLSGIATGFAVERWGVRPVVVVCTLAAALLVGAWSGVESLAGLWWVWAALGGVTSGLLYEPAFTWATWRFPSDRNLALTVITFVGGLASTVFVPLAAALTTSLGWRGALLALALVLVGLHLPLQAWALGGGGRNPALSGASIESTEAHGLPLAAALRTLRFWVLGLGFFASGLVSIALTVFLIPWLTQERSFSLAWASAALAAFGAVQAPGRLLFGRWVLGRSLSLQCALPIAIQAGALGLLLFVRGELGAVAAVGLFGAGNGLVTLARAGSALAAFGPRHYSAVSGGLSAFPATARAVAPIATALLLGEEGRYQEVFTSYALGLAVLVALLAWALASRGTMPEPHGAPPTA